MVLILLHRCYYKDEKSLKTDLVGYLVGIIFGIGLVVSGMNKRSLINKFLTINNNWSPALLFVMAAAVTVNLVTFNLIQYKLERPYLLPEANL